MVRRDPLYPFSMVHKTMLGRTDKKQIIIVEGGPGTGSVFSRLIFLLK
ncbi:hypothetical protein J2T56_003007 [Natronobacillus azotifigens]|uniref:Uncharacterized protein n=1 Tax=Natronobacillus azotifigens TaxID=472978 RepID=A0A9J6RGD9_9BACI|nr:hypothetical protein [Natronobacillus azotifigens]MCZ0704485.1 hypothetical protein [Natronobacillus azotifigens]